MPIYNPTAFQKFQHKPPARIEYAPHPWNKPVCVNTHPISYSTKRCAKTQLCRHKLYAIYWWHLLILWLCSRPNHDPSPQLNIHLPIFTDPRHNGKMKPSTGLCINAPKRHYLTSCEWYAPNGGHIWCLPCCPCISQSTYRPLLFYRLNAWLF